MASDAVPAPHQDCAVIEVKVEIVVILAQAIIIENSHLQTPLITVVALESIQVTASCLEC